MAARISPARLAAYRVLLAVARSRNQHSDDLLRAPAIEALSQADRNLTTALVMGVLRWQLALDSIAAQFLTRRSQLDDEVAIALRLGIFQLLGMERIPAHAALSESVELTKASGHQHASGMVNAVLRRISEAAQRTPLVPTKAHPEWLLERWRTHYGDEAVAAIANYDQQAPPLCLRVTEAAGGTFLTRALVVSEGVVIPENARAQDEGSQLVAEIAGSGKRILDCCAAPGNKTAILAANNPKAEITACDISESRLAAMRRTLAANPPTAHVHCIQADATALPFRDDFDLILCDAPCSGTGTLARNPEIKLRLDPADLSRQRERQLAILRSAYRVLAPGGKLVYSTCSLEPEENGTVTAAFLESEPTASAVNVRTRLDAMEREGSLHARGRELLIKHAVRGDVLQTVPGILPCDGFYVALFTRT